MEGMCCGVQLALGGHSVAPIPRHPCAVAVGPAVCWQPGGPSACAAQKGPGALASSPCPGNWFPRESSVLTKQCFFHPNKFALRGKYLDSAFSPSLKQLEGD